MFQNIKWIFFKEVKVFFGTFMAPLVFGGTAFLNSLFVLILNFNSGTNYVDTTVITFLSFMSTIIISMLILAMGSITEERNRGTLEFLFTAPITDLEIVSYNFV